jgi:hypothetical protein|eukprot:COSAG01_NODE_5232_length_4396_cov_3.872469_1_plen_83_part_00
MCAVLAITNTGTQIPENKRTGNLDDRESVCRCVQSAQGVQADGAREKVTKFVGVNFPSLIADRHDAVVSDFKKWLEAPGPFQ